MKREIVNVVEYCAYCKEEILYEQGFVYNKDKYYHLECYHTMIDVPIEVNAEETYENPGE